MNIVKQNPQIVTYQGKASPAILSTIDLIDHMLGHHHDEVLALVELALWHQEQAEALAAERRALAADVAAALAEAEGLLR